MNAPIEYKPEFIVPTSPFFERLWDGLPWERRADAPRRECWFSSLGQPYTYGRGAGERTYHPAFIEDDQVALILKMIGCNVMDQAGAGVNFEGCFVNGYEGPRDHLGWHADDSPEIDASRPIAVLSLGYAREIWFRENGSDVIEKQMLGDGSLLLMAAGMQQTHQHRIPKNPNTDCGRRISLTYRGLMR